MSRPLGIDSPLTDLLRYFLLRYLPVLRGLSPRTVAADRDAMGSLLAFLRDHERIPPNAATIAELTPDRILRFLDHLEKDRGNSRRTRNHRRAALRTFARSLPLLDEEFRAAAERILAVPPKKTSRRLPAVPTREELAAVFAAVDPRSSRGIRDLALLRLAYNTGARASEIADLRRADLDLPGKAARLRGKGGAVRFCPLWDSTIALLRCHLGPCREGALVRDEHRSFVFLGRTRRPLTRFGVRKIVLRAFARAELRCPTLSRKSFTAHSLRHATGTHLCEAGVDINVIRAWLGHARQETTALYLQLSDRALREALEQSRVLEVDWLKDAPDNADWGQDPETTRWIERW